MKPIEKGCKAVIVGTDETAGIEVTVLGRAPDDTGFRKVGKDKNRWYVDRLLPKGDRYPKEPTIWEGHLQRIDDDQALTSWGHVEKSVGWSPKETVV